MRSAYKWGLFALALLMSTILVWGRFSRHSVPDVEEISRIGSPTGRWTVKVMMVVYGDHWFVNDARYEVRVQKAEEEDQAIVYSTMASGPTGLVVKWLGADELEVQDSADALRDAVRKPHPSVHIGYRPG